MTTQAETKTIPSRRTSKRRTDKDTTPSGRSGPETVTTVKPNVVPIKPPATLTPAQKAAATRAAKAKVVKEQSEALAKELEKSKPAAKAPKPERVTGHRAWATKEVTPAMVKFSRWIEREYPELFPKGIDDRLVMIASKAYGYFQSSDMSLGNSK
jgi:hypothetical protein